MQSNTSRASAGVEKGGSRFVQGTAGVQEVGGGGVDEAQGGCCSCRWGGGLQRERERLGRKGASDRGTWHKM